MTQEPPQQQMSISPQDLAAAMAQALQQSQPAPQQQAPSMTPEQMAQLQKLYNPEQQLMEMLFGEHATPETRMQGLQAFADGLRNNWRAEAGLIADHTGQTLYGAINPYLEDAREIAQQRFFEGVYDGHPGLKNYDPFVKQYMSVVEQDPQFPKDRSQRAAFARERVINQIKQFAPTFDPKVAPAPVQSQPNAPQRGPSQPSQALPSFGSGGGQGPAAKAPQPVSGTPAIQGDRLGLGF